jgi:ferric iron reductase protein FhuF
MIPALATIFRGPLEEIGARLVLADDTRPFLTGAALLDEDRVRDMLKAFARSYAVTLCVEGFDGTEMTAVATQWSKWHFSVVLPPVLIANIARDWHLPTDLEQVGIVLSADHRTAALRLPAKGEHRHFADAHERFSVLIEGHLAPFIRTLSRASALPEKVLWSNAGNIAESVVGECEAQLGADHPGVIHGRALFAAKSLGGGRRNPLFEPVRYIPNRTPARRRRICCLRYRIPALPLCKTCPLDNRRLDRVSIERPDATG